MDRDGREDIAVGAPGEEEGAGVVYIYLGLERGEEPLQPLQPLQSLSANCNSMFSSQSDPEGERYET